MGYVPWGMGHGAWAWVWVATAADDFIRKQLVEQERNGFSIGYVRIH